MKKVLKKIFPLESELREKKQCVFCTEKIKLEHFRDEVSLREYRQSGICQKCQDGFFGKSKKKA